MTPGRGRTSIAAMTTTPENPFEPVTREQHGQMRLRLHGRFGVAAGSRLCPLGLSEIPTAARHYPICLPANGTVPAAVLGMGAGDNHLVAWDGSWEAGHYVPAVLRREPFGPLATPDGRTALGIRRGADLLQRQGVPLFQDGRPAPVTERALALCTAVERDLKAAAGLARAINAAGLAQEAQVSVDGVPAAPVRIVEPTRLAALDGEVVAGLHRQGFLPALHAMAQSGESWPGLAALARRRAAEAAPDHCRRLVRVVEGFLPPDLCRRLLSALALDQATPLSLLDAASAGNARDMARYVDVAVRDTLTVDLAPVEGEVNAAIDRLVRTVIEPHYRCAVDWWEYPQLLRYLPGGHYKAHTDGEYQYPDGWRRIADRDLSAIIYLDEDFTGGELDFPDLGLTVRPRAGMAVVFPADRRFRHGAMPVLTGRRHAIVTWLAAVGTARVVPWPPRFRWIRPGGAG
ncbi:MAG: hypothetical protein OHK0024_07060 [Thalassobaculales bacterium]